MKQIYYAIQNIIRGKDSTIIKVVSLSLGLFISIILFAVVGLQLSHDTFYRDYGQMYVVQTAWDYGNGTGKPSAYNIYPTGATIREHFPEQVESYTVMTSFYQQKLRHGEQTFSPQIICSDSLFFYTMGIPLLRGNAKDLAMNDAVFLSESLAKEIFGSEEPMGQTLICGEKEMLVKGIFAELPENVTYRATAVLPLSIMGWIMNWRSGGNMETMLRLKEGADPDIINRRVNTVLSNYIPMDDHYAKLMTVKSIKVSITPLRGFHLSKEKAKTMLAVVTILGLVVLLTAAFNYALISISSLSHRAKSIGIHKCSGAENGSIFGMFFWETFIVVGISVLLTAFLILNLRGTIEELTGCTLRGMFSPGNLWAPTSAIALLFLIGCVLPGRLFSSIPVTQVFRRYTENKKRWKYPLLFIQFCGTAFLLAFVAVVFLQYRYTMNKNLGFDTERLVSAFGQLPNRENTLTLLRNLPFVEGAEDAYMSIINPPKQLKVNPANGVQFIPRNNYGNESFCRLVRLRLLSGSYHTREGEVLVNPSFVKAMNWIGSGIGEVIPDIGTVTGIIEYNGIDTTEEEPFCMLYPNKSRGANYVHVRLKEPFEDNLTRLNEEMKRVYPQEDIVFQSTDAEIQDLFYTARTFRDSVMITGLVILIITLMGIVGYTNDEVRRRSKEIAIRKINGAEVSTILQMLCRDVAVIALPAVLIGVGASAWVSKQWVVANFRDILPVSEWLFVAVFLVVMLFILGTVIVKSWRVANENPVISIKSE